MLPCVGYVYAGARAHPCLYTTTAIPAEAWLPLCICRQGRPYRCIHVRGSTQTLCTHTVRLRFFVRYCLRYGFCGTILQRHFDIVDAVFSNVAHPAPLVISRATCWCCEKKSVALAFSASAKSHFLFPVRIYSARAAGHGCLELDTIELRHAGCPARSSAHDTAARARHALLYGQTASLRAARRTLPRCYYY